jgi:hypothetical protein
MCQYCKNVNPKLILDEAGWEAQINWDADGYAYITCSIKNKGFASMTVPYLRPLSLSGSKINYTSLK